MKYSTQRKLREFRKNIRTTLSVLLVLLLIVAAGLLASPPYTRYAQMAATHEAGLAVHYISVGDADSTFVICDGKTMLIDGGNIGRGDIVTEYLDKLGVKTLDYMVGTHPHADHMGGLSEVLEKYPVGTVYCSVDESDLGVFQYFQREVESRGKRIQAPKKGFQFSLGSAKVTVIGPTPGKDYSELNNTSLVLRIDYGQTAFLFEGDAQSEAEAEMIASGVPLNATVLRVGHHGSNDSSSAAYLEKVKPKYAIVSCGKNKNNHPHKTMLKRLKKVGAKVYRTDTNGHVLAKSDGHTVKITTQK